MKQRKNKPDIKVLAKKQAETLETLNDFFSYLTHTESKEELWNWLQATITGSFNEEFTFSERSNLVYFYNQLLTLMDAIYTLHLDNWEATIKKELQQEAIRA